jgi:hypothetical protein
MGDPRDDITRKLPALSDLDLRPARRRIRLSNSALDSPATMRAMWERGCDGLVDTVSYHGSGTALFWDDVIDHDTDAGPLEPPG